MNRLNMITDVLKLIRVHNCLIASAAVLLGAHLTDYPPAYFRPLMAAVAAFFVCAAGNGLNDLLDIDSDRINHPQRVLVQQRLSLRQAKSVITVCTGLAVFSGFLCGWSLLATLLVSLGLLVYYNCVGKHQPLIGNLVVVVLGGLFFVVGGLTLDSLATFLLFGPMIPAILATGIHLIRELVKDIADTVGDKSVTSNTIAVKYGVRTSLSLAAAVYLITALCTIYPTVMGWYTISYGLLAVIGVLVPIAVSLVRLFLNSAPLRAGQAADQIKYSVLVGVAALLLA